MTLQDIIKLKLDRLESVPSNFTSSLDKTEKEFYRELLNLVSGLETKDGNIVLSDKNRALVAEIENKIKNLFLNTDFKKQVTEFIKQFNVQADLNNQYFAKAFPGATIPQVAAQILAKKKEAVANLLLGDGLDVNFINPIKAQLNLAVDSQASFTDTINQLQKIVTGDKQTDSKILQYSKQIAGDSFAISDRTYLNIVSNEIGAEWFKWSGGVLPTSRSICIENHNKFFHKKEIEAMADEDWAGKMEGTNAQTIFAAAGGYNCHHNILPVSVFAVPMDVIQRNIANGNFIPTTKEKELLGLAA